MSSLSTQRSRPVEDGAAIPKSFGGDTTSIPLPTDAPPHDTLTGPCCWENGLQRYSLGFEHGWSQGYVAAQIDAQAHAEQVRVARSAEDHRAIHAARRKAAARWSA